MKLAIAKGTTSKIIEIFIQDSSSSVGAGLTGLVYNSAGLTGYYLRNGAGSTTAITLATMTAGTWATGGFVEVDATNMPGIYQLSLPDAVLATGANSVVVMLKGATNMAPVLLEIQLDMDETTLFNVTKTQPGQGTPAAAQSPGDILRYLWKWARNKSVQTGTYNEFYNDDGTTVDQKQATTGGATTTVGEMETGP